MRFTGSYNVAQAAFRPAGGVWEAAQDLSAPGQAAFEPQVAFDAAGNGLALWARNNGTHYIAQAAVRPPGGSWSAAQDVSALGEHAFNARLAVDPAGNALAVWVAVGANAIAKAAFRPAGGVWEAPVDLSASGASAQDPRVAFDPSGNAVAVWSRTNGTHYIVQAAFRPAGGAWQLPATDLSALGESAFEADVALDAAGNAIAVWRRSSGTDHIAQAAVRPAGGAWQVAQDLSAAGGTALEPSVAFSPGGDAIAIWRRATGGIAIAQAAVRPAGGAWQAAQDISVAGQSAFRPQVALDPAGNAVAVWQRSNGTNTIVQAVLRPASTGTWDAPKDLSAVGQSAIDPQVAFDPAGNALAVWQRSDGTNTIVQASPYDATAPELRNLRVPATGYARQRLTFTVNPFDTWSPMSPPVWNFGDGKSASGPTVGHTYARRGAYTVTVTLADVLANETATTRLLTLRTARCFGSAATRVGSSRIDRIAGTRGRDVIVTLGGADRVRGRGGNDKICGGPGRDRLFGGAGNDRLNGGPGRDTCAQGGGRGRLVSC